MEPVPGWARALGIAVGVGTVLIGVPIVALSVLSAASTIGQVQGTTSFDVGPAPEVQVDARFGSVVIEAGRDGRVVVDDRRSAGAVTRAGAAAALDAMAVDVSRRGDLVVVRQAGPPLGIPAIDRNSIVTVRVPVRTNVDLRNVGDLHIQGIDGSVRFSGSGSAVLQDTTLRGTSSLDAPLGDMRMTNVTVAGSTVITKTVGIVTFDGRLAPGGSSLDIENGGGDVTVVLPRPTDARATVTTDAGKFQADGTWLFTPDQVAVPRRWTADLQPNPRGTVKVHATLGKVDFASR